LRSRGGGGAPGLLRHAGQVQVSGGGRAKSGQGCERAHGRVTGPSWPAQERARGQGAGKGWVGAPGVPGRSPIPVLFWPMGAYLRSSDGIRSSSPGMIEPRATVAKNNLISNAVPSRFPALLSFPLRALMLAPSPPACRLLDRPR